MRNPSVLLVTALVPVLARIQELQQHHPIILEFGGIKGLDEANTGLEARQPLFGLGDAKLNNLMRSAPVKYQTDANNQVDTGDSPRNEPKLVPINLMRDPTEVDSPFLLPGDPALRFTDELDMTQSAAGEQSETTMPTPEIKIEFKEEMRANPELGRRTRRRAVVFEDRNFVWLTTTDDDEEDYTELMSTVLGKIADELEAPGDESEQADEKTEPESKQYNLEITRMVKMKQMNFKEEDTLIPAKIKVERTRANSLEWVKLEPLSEEEPLKDKSTSSTWVLIDVSAESTPSAEKLFDKSSGDQNSSGKKVESRSSSGKNTGDRSSSKKSKVGPRNDSKPLLRSANDVPLLPSTPFVPLLPVSNRITAYSDEAGSWSTCDCHAHSLNSDDFHPDARDHYCHQRPHSGIEDLPSLSMRRLEAIQRLLNSVSGPITYKKVIDAVVKKVQPVRKKIHVGRVWLSKRDAGWLDFLGKEEQRVRVEMWWSEEEEDGTYLPVRATPKPTDRGPLRANTIKYRYPLRDYLANDFFKGLNYIVFGKLDPSERHVTLVADLSEQEFGRLNLPNERDSKRLTTEEWWRYIGQHEWDPSESDRYPEYLKY
jgi:hypothetical protein